MSILAVWLEGLGRVRRAPALVCGLWLTVIAVTIPPALVLRDSISAHLGSSLEANTAADSVNWDWMQEFRASTQPLASTLRPDVIGFATVLDNASAMADMSTRPQVVILASAVYVLLLIFLSGGVIDRLARDRAVRAYGFFSACGGLAFRVFRLSVISGLVYAGLFGVVHAWLLDDVFTSMTRDLSVERTAFAVRMLLYLLFFLIVGAFNMLFDYAKIRLVVEDRRSVLAAIVAAMRFVRVQPRFAAGVYAMNVMSFGAVLAVYALVAPGAGTSGRSMWGAFIVGQAYIATRQAVKLVFWASEIAAFQSRLAHAGFVRRRMPRWPESATAEALAMR
jgi:hypothetical protein